LRKLFEHIIGGTGEETFCAKPALHRRVSGRVTDVFYNACVDQDGEGSMPGIFAARHDLTDPKPAEVKKRADDGPVPYGATPIAF
jgi:hypothetical protein